MTDKKTKALKLALIQEAEIQMKDHPSKDARWFAKSVYEYLMAEQPEQQQEPVAWCPDVCPITGLPFFMWIEHHETGQMVPTYGGPYDSYTIPVRDKDGSYCRERYDHDLGGWLTDEVEDVGVQIVSDQAYVSDESPASKPWVGLTDEDLAVCDEDGVILARYWAKLREKNAQSAAPEQKGN